MTILLGVESIFSSWVSGTADANGVLYWRGFVGQVYPENYIVVGVAIDVDNIMVIPYTWNKNNSFFGFKCLYAASMSPVSGDVGFTAYFTAR